MPAAVTFSRPAFTDTDSLPNTTFNSVAVLSGTVADAEPGAYGVIRLAGDLTGTAASPQLAATGATAGSYGVSGMNVPHITVDAKGRVTAVVDRELGTPYSKTLVESADEATARTVLGLGGTTFLDAVYVAVMSRQYPVGEMLITRRSANPSTWLGFGTWESYGAGKTLVGFNAAETEFDSLDKIGGAKTHTITVSDLPAHTHSIPALTGTTNTAGAHTHGDRYLNSFSGGFGPGYAGNNGSNAPQPTGSAGDHSHTLTTNASTTGSTGTGNTPHNNLQPYITVFFWKRTV